MRQWLRRWTRALSPANAVARVLELAGLSDTTHAAATAGLRALIDPGDEDGGAVSNEQKAVAFAEVLAALARRQDLVLVVEDAGVTARHPPPRWSQRANDVEYCRSADACAAHAHAR